MSKEPKQPGEFTDTEKTAAYMDGYGRGEADGSNGRGYDTTLSETIKDALDWNRATGYDTGFADFSGA